MPDDSALEQRLSTRQRSLLKQLERVVKTAQETELPMEVLEILGFGSFFRNKRNAKDVDIKIEYGKEHQFFVPFCDLMKTISENARQNDVDSTHPTPYDLFDKLIADRLKENDNKEFLEEFQRICGNWLQGITWNMLYNEEYNSVLDRHRLTDRILKRSSRNVIISHGIGRLLTNTIFSVWSTKKPDFKENIRQIFSPEVIRRSRLSCLQEFEIQIAALKLHSEFLYKWFKLETEHGYTIVPEKEVEKYFPAITRRFMDEISWNAMTEDELHELGIEYKFDSLVYQKYTDDELEELVENQKRKELKNMRETVQVFRSIIYYLDYYIHRMNSGEIPRDKVALYVAWYALEKIPKGEVNEPRIRENLRRLGLPEDMITTENSKGYGKTWYAMAREDELT